MIFLIRYDRDLQRQIAFEQFQDADRDAAEATRYQLELEITRKNLNQEVVLLEAPSEPALRVTHSRYFDDIDEMLSKLADSTSGFVVRERKD